MPNRPKKFAKEYPSMPIAERELREVMVYLTDDKTAMERQLICTPVFANYQSLSHWVVAANGSPPRGLCIISAESTSYIVGYHKHRVLDSVIARSFWAAFLKGKTESFTIPFQEVYCA
jgi:hypothetical protein